MQISVISDVHIKGKNDPYYPRLLKWVEKEGKKQGIIVFAGDIFDLFVGEKALFVERYSDFIVKIREACHLGCKIFYIEGNHDFQLEAVFRGLEGLMVEQSEIILNSGDKKILISHGDLADSRNIRYRLLRAFFRSTAAKALVRSLPGTWVDWIGNTSSNLSRGRKALVANDLPPEIFSKVRQSYHDYAALRAREGFDAFVMGHCHDLDEKIISNGKQVTQYINMGYPKIHGTYLSWSDEQSKFLRIAVP
jgi:UDP-2,3-diacylglucosamine hydrolase